MIRFLKNFVALLKAPYLVVVHLNARLQPLDRGALYEEPLEQWLKDHDMGELCGGGTLMHKGGELENCDVEMRVRDLDEEVVQTIIAFFEELGTPKGSKIILETQDREIPFGTLEGLALYINGADLDDSVYEECDINVVIEEIDRLLGKTGKMYSHWVGPRETALYFYGSSFDSMNSSIADFVNSYPLCEKCRIEQIA